MDNGGSPSGGGEINPGVANNRANPTVNAAQNPQTQQNPASRQPLRYVSPTQPYDNGPATPPTPSNPPLTQMPTPNLSVVNPRPVSTGKGDIILNPAAEAKKAKQAKTAKRAPLIILMILCALFAVGIICFVVYRNLSDSSDNSSDATATNTATTVTGALADFNTYANYIFYGTDSADPITGEEPETSYTYSYNQYIYNGADSDQKYFNEIYQKYNTFYDTFRRGNPNINSGELYDAISDYKQLMDFLKINPASDAFDYNKVTEAYLEGGSESAQAMADRILSLVPRNNSYADAFSQAKSGEFDRAIDYLSSLQSAGCISGQNIDSTCALDFYFSDDYVPPVYNSNTSTEDDDSTDENTEDTDSSEENTDYTTVEPRNLLNEYYQKIGTDCWKIKTMLEEGNIS